MQLHTPRRLINEPPPKTREELIELFKEKREKLFALMAEVRNEEKNINISVFLNHLEGLDPNLYKRLPGGGGHYDFLLSAYNQLIEDAKVIEKTLPSHRSKDFLARFWDRVAGFFSGPEFD